MNIAVILILMIFAHIIDDFYLQRGLLAELKQKTFWTKYPEKYKYDYIPALIFHAISWSTMIILPILLEDSFNPHWFIYIAWTINIIIHAYIDNLKANKLKINLIQDQTIHLIQILILWILYVSI